MLMNDVSDTAKITANYEVVTPMMSAGANFSAEFRLPEYVNLVRWWSRFLALGRYGGDEAVATFWEAVLFGWSEKPFGQKLVRFRLVSNKEEMPIDWAGGLKLGDWSGVSYLTAQGFKARDETATEPASLARKPVNVSSFSIAAALHPPVREIYEKWWEQKGETAFSRARLDGWQDEWKIAKSTLIDAMALIGLAGGLGARSRRGFGSLAVSELIVGEEKVISGLPASVACYGTMLKKYLGIEPADPRQPLYNGVPPYTALSDQTSVRICATGTCARTLMNDIGWAFQIYRSWGQKRKDDDHASTADHRHYFKNGAGGGKIDAGAAKAAWYDGKFTADHDKFYAGNFPPTANFDNRAVFGLPHNYGKKISTGWYSGTVPPAHNDTTFGRRASPLMFHFHRLANDGGVVFLAMVAPAKFAPDGAKLRANGNGHNNSMESFVDPAIPDKIDWKLLKGFHAFVSDPANPSAPGPTRGSGGGVEKTSYTPISATGGTVL